MKPGQHTSHAKCVCVRESERWKEKAKECLVLSYDGFSLGIISLCRVDFSSEMISFDSSP